MHVLKKLGFCYIFVIKAICIKQSEKKEVDFYVV
jgi:hypothetical protein